MGVTKVDPAPAISAAPAGTPHANVNIASAKRKVEDISEAHDISIQPE
jgi:hypothetical protein